MNKKVNNVSRCVLFLTITLKGIRRKNQRIKGEGEWKIIRMPFAIDSASDDEELNYNSGESDVKD